MNIQYFGGAAGQLGEVSLLPQTDFASLAKELLGHPVTLNLTRAQFFALPKPERDRIKRVPYITPAAFRRAQSKRLYAEATLAHLVALDIDDSAQAAPFAHRPQLAADALEPYACAVYATASSTPEAPRLRVLVSAMGLPLQRYSEAVDAVARRLGLPSVTRESRVAVQPMYLPCQFSDDDPLVHHPLLLARVEGRAMTPSDLDSEADPDAAALPAAAPKGRGAPDGDEERVADLDFLRPTRDDVSMDDIREALNALDPDCTYPEWLEIAASLRHQFPHDPESSEAYAAFDAWSSRGAKYAGTEETLAKWRSLRHTPKGRAPVTVRTLLHRAAEAGWSRAAAVQQRCYARCMDWLSDPNRTATELLSQAAKRIAATPLLSSLERGTLLSRLQDVLRQRKLKVSRADLKREMSAVERELRGRDAADANSLKSTPDNQLPPWARGLCYVAATNEFFQRSSGRSYNPEVLDNVYGVYLMNGDSESGKPTTRPRDFLLNLARIPRVDAFRYDPAHPDQIFVTEGKKRYVNIYVPSYPEADASEAAEAADMLHEHAANLFPCEREQCLLLDFMAYQVQNPGAKIRWATLIQGAQGCGKTALADVMRAALGHHHVRTVDADVLLRSSYNDWAAGSQLVVMEEVRVVGHNRHEVMNRLKPCITNEVIAINRKYQDIQQVPNVSNYLLLTNHHDSLAVQDGDRRYFVLHSALQTKEQVLALGADYFRRLYSVINGKGAGIRHFFENWEISREFNPHGHAPHTRHLKELVESGSSPLASAVRAAVHDGVAALVKPDLVSVKHLRTAIEPERLGVTSDQTLAAVLRELGFRAAGRVRLGDERSTLWVPAAAKLDDAAAAELARQRLDGAPASGAEDFKPLM